MNGPPTSTADERRQQRRDEIADELLANAQEMDRLVRAGKQSTDAYLKAHDDPDNATKRGYSHGTMRGESRRGHEVLHLNPDHWQNVGAGWRPDAMSAGEADEERRGAGALADARHGDDVSVSLPRRAIDPRSWMTGWGPSEMAAYFVGRRHSGVWNDQAWNRYLARKKRTLPNPIPCASCGTVFQPERSTARYCSGACRSQAARDRATR